MKQITEESYWFVIGAHQTGASERQCAELAGLPKTVTHNIISNFKKLGSPHPSQLSLDALFNESNVDIVNRQEKKRRMEETKNKSRKRGRPRKPPGPPSFMQTIVREALCDATRPDQKSMHSTKPIYPLNRPNTPSTDEMIETVCIPHEEIDDFPLTPRSGSTHLSEEEEEEENWTLEDDKTLLMHVLGLPLSMKWKDVESQFNDRHLAKMCADRWEYLKRQLAKEVQFVTNES